MEITQVSLKRRYGWRTISIKDFLSTFDVQERLVLVSDLEQARCINEYGEYMNPEDAIKEMNDL